MPFLLTLLVIFQFDCTHRILQLSYGKYVYETSFYCASMPNWLIPNIIQTHVKHSFVCNWYVPKTLLSLRPATTEKALLMRNLDRARHDDELRGPIGASKSGYCCKYLTNVIPKWIIEEDVEGPNSAGHELDTPFVRNATRLLLRWFE